MTTPDARVIASVVIPAHNESAVIGRCLDHLLSTVSEGELEVVVACNGCTDDTADIARSYASVQVVETPIAGKIAGLNLGDTAATAFPRLYLDADVLMDTDSVRAVAESLAGDHTLAASPMPTVDTTASTRSVRAYYDIWIRMDWILSSTSGAGCYALSREGRRRFGEFPDVYADDHWLNAQFAPHEKRRVTDATSTVRAAPDLRHLIRRKARVLAYARLLDEQLRAAPGRAPSRGAGLRDLARSQPRLIPRILLYGGIALITNCLAAWKVRRGRLAWVSDR